MALTGRLYGRLALRHVRTHHAIRMFVAGLGLTVRAARHDPQTVNERCRKLGIKGKRLEVRTTRLVIGRRSVVTQDQTHRWANAAAYIAHPPNRDVPPPNWREALRYINRRGVRGLSNLYARRGLGRADEHDDLAFVPSDLAAFYDEPGVNTSVEWSSPRHIFQAMGNPQFDLDPASPGAGVVPWIRAATHYTIADDGLIRSWFGFVWLNPPYGRGVLPRWTEKFAAHGNGIILVPERTSTKCKWWQSLVKRADLILCVSRKITFVRADERVGQFPIGTHLVAIGPAGVQALIRASQNGLGLLMTPGAHTASSHTRKIEGNKNAVESPVDFLL